jgi:hypothetical protein
MCENNTKITRPEDERVFYIYRHLRNDTGKPFYIGRGKRRQRKNTNTIKEEYIRAYSRQSRTDYWNSIVDKHGHIVEIMVDNLTYHESIEKEQEFIKLYGRKDKGGILANFSDGGEGNINYIPRPETLQKFRDAANTIEDCVREFVFPEPNTGCFLWGGSCDESIQRPLICYKGKSGSATRVLYEYFTGTKLSADNIIKQTCNNKFCVNPDHLEIITTKDRANDRVKNGTQSKGSGRHNSKFTEEDVVRIKTLKAQGARNIDIAKEYNVTKQAIGLIARGVNWKWLNG